MTTAEFRASVERAAARTAEPAGTPTGRSYHVASPTRDLAPGAARIQARSEGHTRPGRVLHVELVAPGLYEVVLAE